ncbi:hypothetical protein J2Y49_005969 [Azospirillum sp. BE72]|nr:hypothetical protein [Azospirillum sp. BE72]
MERGRRPLGAETGYVERDPYGAARYVRVGGETPFAEDVYSPLKNTTVRPKVQNRGTTWPTPNQQGSPSAEAMYHAGEIDRELESPPAD